MLVNFACVMFLSYFVLCICNIWFVVISYTKSSLIVPPFKDLNVEVWKLMRKTKPSPLTMNLDTLSSRIILRMQCPSTRLQSWHEEQRLDMWVFVEFDVGLVLLRDLQTVLVVVIILMRVAICRNTQLWTISWKTHGSSFLCDRKLSSLWNKIAYAGVIVHINTHFFPCVILLQLK